MRKTPSRDPSPRADVPVSSEAWAEEILQGLARQGDAPLDIAEGALALAAFEMAEAGGVGVHIDDGTTSMLFGEDQARYLIACNYDMAEELMIRAGQAGVLISTVGRFTGDTVKFGTSEAPLADLVALYRGAFADAVG